ncbi:hypothetical protein ACE01N_19360 [Saccharicrinis sp. FJH2]|uniref:hypothetical protein n=1 Tax=Saccharicrinis sp. FJH65 TaxID=3344659 RepID=UPI0035F3149D
MKMEIQKDKKSDYVAYEYLTVQVRKDMEPLYTDCYENFGWIDMNNSNNTTLNVNVDNAMMISLKFKRDRKIKNRSMLFALQRKCENALKKIDQLEKSKEMPALIFALIIGILGLGFIAGAVFSFLSGKIFIGIMAASFGGIGCVLPYYVYKKSRIEKEVKVAPIIEEQYDFVYKTCEQAKGLLV